MGGFPLKSFLVHPLRSNPFQIEKQLSERTLVAKYANYKKKVFAALLTQKPISFNKADRDGPNLFVDGAGFISAINHEPGFNGLTVFSKGIEILVGFVRSDAFFDFDRSYLLPPT